MTWKGTFPWFFFLCSSRNSALNSTLTESWIDFHMKPNVLQPMWHFCMRLIRLEPQIYAGIARSDLKCTDISEVIPAQLSSVNPVLVCAWILAQRPNGWPCSNNKISYHVYTTDPLPCMVSFQTLIPKSKLKVHGSLISPKVTWLTCPCRKCCRLHCDNGSRTSIPWARLSIFKGLSSKVLGQKLLLRALQWSHPIIRRSYKTR